MAIIQHGVWLGGVLALASIYAAWTDQLLARPLSNSFAKKKRTGFPFPYQCFYHVNGYLPTEPALATRATLSLLIL